MSKDIQAFICIGMMCGWMPKGDFELRQSIAKCFDSQLQSHINNDQLNIIAYSALSPE